jgi:hypothetical protein
MGELVMDDQATNNEAPLVTEPPLAPSLDEVWWKRAESSADIADAEKRAIEAQDFQQHRAFKYIMSEGREDIGGWRGAGCSGRAIYRQRGRMIDWR